MIETLLLFAAGKAVAASFLGAAAVLSARFVRRPDVVALLWLVVLLGFFGPPLLPIGILPRPPEVAGSWPASRTGDDGGLRPAGAGPAEGRTAARPVAGSVSPASGATNGWLDILAAVWLAGSIAVVLLALWRLARFSRLLRGTTAVTTSRPGVGRELERACAELARSLGLRRRPRLRLVDARISPLVRIGGGGVELVFPAALAERLTAPEARAILAHELAHLSRRDHLVRVVELAASSLFWWHPVTWWARRRLHRAEERACDARVVALAPVHAADYARAIVRTVEFLAGAPGKAPALACGLGEFRNLKERLTMIMQAPKPEPLSSSRRWLLAGGAVALLFVFPTWAERGPETRERSGSAAEAEEGAAAEAGAAVPPADRAAEERALRVALATLRDELHALDARARERALGREARQIEAELARAGAGALSLEAQRELEAAQAELARAHEAASARGRAELDAARAELERRRARGDLAREELEAAQGRIGRFHHDRDAARRELALAAAELDRSRGDLADAQGEAALAELHRARERTSAGSMDALADAIRQLQERVERLERALDSRREPIELR